MKTLAIAMGLAALTAAPAIAEPETRQTVHMEVDLSRADLTTETGLRAAYRSLRIAANRACRVRNGLRTMGSELDLDCRDALVEAALREINAPQLTALHTPEQSPDQLARRDG